MPDDFVIARNPDPDSALPFLVRLPLGPDGIVLKARDTWPRTAKVYCHRAPGWPADAEVVERVPVRACVRRGAAIDLVLDRGRENRSQFVLTRIRGGREAIFWQSARTTKQARPAVALPTARASGVRRLRILVDGRERYAYRFAHQQADVVSGQRLRCGDYGIEVDGALAAAVERKSLDDLARSLLDGSLRFALTELAELPRAAVAVEDRWSQVFKLTYARPSVVADAVAEAQVRWPTVPIVFLETRPLAEEWTYRFLAAAAAELSLVAATESLEDTFATAGPLPPPPPAGPSAADIRAWAAAHGWAVSDRGRIPAEVRAAYDAARG